MVRLVSTSWDLINVCITFLNVLKILPATCDDDRLSAAVPRSSRDVGDCCAESSRWSAWTSSTRVERTASDGETATQGSTRLMDRPCCYFQLLIRPLLLCCMGGTTGGVWGETMPPSLLRHVPRRGYNKIQIRLSHSDRIFCSMDAMQLHLLQISIYLSLIHISEPTRPY